MVISKIFNFKFSTIFLTQFYKCIKSKNIEYVWITKFIWNWIILVAPGCSYEIFTVTRQYDTVWITMVITERDT